jgi:hypothetical protein
MEKLEKASPEYEKELALLPGLAKEFSSKPNDHEISERFRLCLKRVGLYLEHSDAPK